MEWDSGPGFELYLDVNFPDLEHMCDSVKSWNLDFRPLSSQRNDLGAGRIMQARSGPVEFGYARIHQSLEQFGDPPAGLITFGVPGLALNQLWWRGHEVSQQTVLVFHGGNELYSLSGPDFEVHTISVSEELIGLICEDLNLNIPSKKLQSEIFHIDQRALKELQLYLPWMTDNTRMNASIESRWIVEILVTSWLTSPDAVKTLIPPKRSRDLAMEKCLGMIEQSGWEELTPTRLCQATGVSERTLQYAFRERFGVTPAAFLKARRMNAVRKRLRDPSTKSGMIGEIASDFGFWHLSQFAVDYRLAFGEAPSETLRNSIRSIRTIG